MDRHAVPRAVLRRALCVRGSLRAATLARLSANRRARWAAQSVPPGAVILLGDSLAARFPAELLADVPRPVVRRGAPGETARELLDRVGDLAETAPRAVVVQAGTNDVLRGDAPAAIAGVHAELLSALGVAVPAAGLVVMALPPITPWRARPADVRAVNAELRRLTSIAGGTWIDGYEPLATADGRPHADATTDGVHLTPAAYATVAALLAPALARM